MAEQTIESVREELEKYPDLLYRFNLGVSLAQKENEILGNSKLYKQGCKDGYEKGQKEFLDFLEKETHPEQYLLLKKELKQSLGVKE